MDANVILAQDTMSVSQGRSQIWRSCWNRRPVEGKASSRAIGVSRGSSNIACGDAREDFCHASRFRTERIQIISYEWREHALTPAV